MNKCRLPGTYTGDVAIVGMHDRRGGADDSERQIIKIAAKWIHPDYDSPDRANDVALLKLEKPAVLGPKASPICLPNKVLSTVALDFRLWPPSYPSDLKIANFELTLGPAYHFTPI